MKSGPSDFFIKGSMTFNIHSDECEQVIYILTECVAHDYFLLPSPNYLQTILWKSYGKVILHSLLAAEVQIMQS